MNFLQLVQRLAQKAGVARNTSITTVVSQTGKALELVNCVNDAWMDIQGRHQDWGWKRASASFTTVNGQATYTLSEAGTTNFGLWDRDSFRNYLTASGTAAEVFMTYMDYKTWRDIYQFGSNRTATSQPQFVTIIPSTHGVGLGPVPPSGYTVTADYYTCPTEMSANADIPSLPVHYHMAIVYRAMMLYAPSDAAGEIYEEGEIEFNKLMTRIENDYLPEVELAGPLT